MFETSRRFSLQIMGYPHNSRYYIWGYYFWIVLYYTKQKRVLSCEQLREEFMTLN